MQPLFNFPKPDHPPRSAEEAAEIAQRLLEAAGLRGASAVLVEPATSPDGFAGARIQITLPERSLEAFLRDVAQKAAENQGAKLQELKLTLQLIDSRSIQCEVRGAARMLMSTLAPTMTGEIHAPNSGTVVLKNLRLDAGKGMFAGMASAFLSPHIRQMEGVEHKIRDLIRCALEIETLQVEPSPEGNLLRMILRGETA